MPAIAGVLGSMIQQKVDANIRAAFGHGPMQMPNPSFFVMMCKADGTGIVNGAPSIPFKTTDTGNAGTPPIPGAGTGTGIKVDADWFEKELYTRIRAKAIAKYGRTSHEAYPPPKGTSGEYLQAICKGITMAVKEHFATAWILTSVHPIVYAGTGKINQGDFLVVPGAAVGGLIYSSAPPLRGEFWTTMAQVTGEVYAEAIMRHSTSQVSITGVCVPGPTQLCNLPIPGTGTGTAA